MLRCLIAALAVVLFCASAALARPFTVDDLLAEESFGAAAFDPSGRWLVFEQRDRFDSARRFDHDLAIGVALSRLYVTPVTGKGRAEPLVPGPAGAGVVMADFSPSGDRLAVFRLQGRTWRLGVVELDGRDVRWFDLTPDQVRGGRVLQWLNDEEVLVIAWPEGELPWRMQAGWVAAERAPRLWAAAAAGQVSATVLGSGAYATVRRRPPPRNLVRVNVRTGARQVLARGEFIDFEVSPTGERVAIFEAGADVQSREDGPVQGPAGLATQATRLSILDLTGGGRIDVAPDRDFLSHLLSWASSGDELLVFARGPSGLWTDGALLRVRASDGAAIEGRDAIRPVVDLRPEFVHAGWLGGEPIVLARHGADVRTDWFRIGPAGVHNLTRAIPASPERTIAAGPDALVVAAAGALWRVDSAGETSSIARPAGKPALPNPPPGRGGRLTYGTLPERSWLTAWDGSSRSLASVDSTGRGNALRLPSRGEVLAVEGQGSAVLVREADIRGRQVLKLSTRSGSVRQIAEINRHLTSVDLPRIVPVRSGPEGTVLGWLFLPAESDVPPPLVIKIYPGQAYAAPPAPKEAAGAGFMGDIRVLVGRGYAVLTPSLPRADEPEGPLPGMAARILKVEAAARSDAASRGAYDPERVALIGYSFGGLSTLAAVTQTNRFRAAVALAGVSDMTAMWAKLQPPYRTTPEEGVMSNWSTGNVEAGQVRLGVPPWRAPELYRKNSPIMAADRIETPLLLMTGDRDFPDQSEAMFGALYRQGKDAILVTYWGEGHAFLSPGNVRDMYDRIFTFFEERLDSRELRTSSGRSASRPFGLANVAPRLRSPPPT